MGHGPQRTNFTRLPRCAFSLPCQRVFTATSPPRSSSSAPAWSITVVTCSSSTPFTAFDVLPLVLVLALLRHDVLHQLVAVLLVWQVPVSCQRLPPPAALGWRLGDALDAPLEDQPQLANLGAPHRPLSQSNACDVRFLGCADTRNRNCAFLCVRAWLHLTTTNPTVLAEVSSPTKPYQTVDTMELSEPRSTHYVQHVLRITGEHIVARVVPTYIVTKTEYEN